MWGIKVGGIAAAMHGEENAYLVWGVHSDTHELNFDNSYSLSNMKSAWASIYDAIKHN